MTNYHTIIIQIVPSALLAQPRTGSVLPVKNLEHLLEQTVSLVPDFHFQKSDRSKQAFSYLLNHVMAAVNTVRILVVGDRSSTDNFLKQGIVVHSSRKWHIGMHCRTLDLNLLPVIS